MATDTIRTQAQLLSMLTPNNNTVPRTTALLAQTARDLITTMFANTTFYNALAYGLVGDNSTENALLINAMATALPSGACVVLPPGIYVYTPALLSPISKTLRFVGHTWGGTYLKSQTNLTGNCIEVTVGGVSFEHISFIAAADRTSGATIHLQTNANDFNMTHCHAANYAVFILDESVAHTHLTDVYGSSSATGVSNIGYQAFAGQVRYLTECIFINPTIIAGSIGVLVGGIGSISPGIVRCDRVFIGNMATGMTVYAPAGTTVSEIGFVNGDIDTCNVSVNLHTIGTGIITYISFNSSWVGDTSPSGANGSHSILIDDDAAGTGIISNINFLDVVNIGNTTGKNALKCDTARLTYLRVDGGFWAATNADVILIKTNQNHFNIGNGVFQTATAGYGVNIPAGTSTIYYVVGNDMAAGCVSGSVNNVPASGTVGPNY